MGQDVEQVEETGGYGLGRYTQTSSYGSLQ